MIIQSSSSDGTTTVLKLKGDLKFNVRNLFLRAIDDARAAGTTSINLNMEKVSDIDSAGLALLRNANEELSQDGISFNLSHPQGRVLKILDLAKIPEFIPIL